MKPPRVYRNCMPLACAYLLLSPLAAQTAAYVDNDGDGLSDTLEETLLQRFRPTLMVSGNDCSTRPARFTPGMAVPTVAAEDGTIYGQARPHPTAEGALPQIELHFYHLWRRDCGRLGHALDAEHVSVLLEALQVTDFTNANAWHATYWYAAAHEDTVCDGSQISRASTLDATTHGATVWISSGKHASFLNEELCRHGCGSDRCTASTQLASAAVINLGEANLAMAGAVWVASARWPLREKLTRSDFLPGRLARVEQLPVTDIAWTNPAKRPAQAAILGGNSAVDGTLRGGEATGGALAMGSRSTDTAIAVAGSKTSSALGTAARSTSHALSRSLHSVKRALGGSNAAPDAH